MSEPTNPSDRARDASRGGRPPAGEPRRWWVRYGVVFVFAVLLVNAVAGERGYVEMRRLERRHAEAQAALAARRAENEALKIRIHRLRTDASAIEAAVRGQLGYARPGEVVFTVREAPQERPTQPAVPPARRPPGSR